MVDPPVIAAIAWAVVLGVAGGLLTRLTPWYYALRRPPWQPPDWLFGPAWTLILGLAAWAAVLAWRGADGDPAAERAIITLYAVNFLFHLLWTPIFFIWRRPDLALVEVVFLWASVLALIIGVRPHSATASWLLVPYISWVSFAALLNLAVVRLNPRARVPA